MIARTTEELVKLNDVTELILYRAKVVPNRPKFRDEAINWGDLHCRGANYCRNDHGDEFNSVIIEEASPSCTALPRFVHRFLHKLGYERIEIDVDW